MTYEINETHDPNLESWVESANDPNTDFPIQNLPFCVFTNLPDKFEVLLGVMIGDQILNLDSLVSEKNLFDRKEKGWQIGGTIVDHGTDASIGESRRLAGVMSHVSPERAAFRQRLVEILKEDADESVKRTVRRHLVPVSEAHFLRPADIGDYTDFYCSIYHAKNVGSMFRPDAP